MGLFINLPSPSKYSIHRGRLFIPISRLLSCLSTLFTFVRALRQSDLSHENIELSLSKLKHLDGTQVSQDSLYNLKLL